MSTPDDDFLTRATNDAYRASTLDAALKVFSAHASNSSAEVGADSVLADARKFLGFLQGESTQ